MSIFRLAIALLMLGQLPVPVPPSAISTAERMTDDDIAVVVAAIDHSVRAEYLRLRPGPRPSDDDLRIIDRTPPNCEPGHPIEPPGCLLASYTESLTKSREDARLFAALLKPSIAAELAAAFRKANVQPVSIPDGRIKARALYPKTRFRRESSSAGPGTSMGVMR